MSVRRSDPPGDSPNSQCVNAADKPAAAEIASAAGWRSSLNSPPAACAAGGLFSKVERVSYQQARAWAIAAGLCHPRFGLDLISVNRERQRLGLSIFILKR